MADRVLASFLARQEEEGRKFAAESDLLTLVPIGAPADRYLVEFRCRGLVKRDAGEVVEASRFQVGIWFHATYLRVAQPFRVLTWLGPHNVWHPNISACEPLVCVGRLEAGTGLVDILYQLFEIITWNKVTMREDDALNAAACQWARQHPDRYPVDRRPLKRRAPAFHITERVQTDGPAA